MKNTWIEFIILACASGALLTGCESPTTLIVQVGESVAIVDTPADVNSSPLPQASPSPGVSPGPSPSPEPGFDPTRTVCDPFFNNATHPGADLDHGVVASLKYLKDDQPRFQKVVEYKASAVPVDATIFFNDINVPTRAFSLGFATQTGEMILNASGNTLYEYFSVHFESQLQLTPADPMGDYQFAVISDDGSVVQIDTGNGFQELINNDSVHSSRFTAATRPISFSSRSVKVPVKIDYFQGPRYHIAMIFLWRPWPQTGSYIDPSEGKAGNAMYFDSTVVPSKATSTYNALLTRGWRPISAANFALPGYIARNPCHVLDPVTTQIINSSPSGDSVFSTSIQFDLSSNYAAATYQCSIDGGPVEPCLAPKSYSGLSVGTHEFKVFASANGQTDPVGAKRTWTILPPLRTMIDGANPAALVTNQTSLSLNFSANYPGATFQCRLDSGSLTSCTSPKSFGPLAQGNHVVTVFASVGGEMDPVGATYNWKIDTAAPKILAGTSVMIGSTSFTVRWTTDEPSTSRISWGLGTTVGTIVEDLQLVTDHVLTIPGLAPLTTYSYTYGGKDEAGNSVTSATNRVRTAQ